jgi:hypothetical protein
VPTGIAILQAPRKDLIQRRPRYQAKLTETRHSLGQPPIRYTRTHSTLNYYRFTHSLIIRQVELVDRISFVTFTT